MATVLVLGGGFGGITAARELAASGLDVTLVERKSTFMMGLRKLWILAGTGTRAEGERPLDRLAGVTRVQTQIRAIDAATRTVRTDAGELRADYLIIALGAEPRPDLVPGWSSAAFNLYDVADVERLASRLRTLERGRVALVIAGVPYKCPPAPYEAAMLLKSLGRFDVAVTSPQPMALPVAGKAACGALESWLAERRIAFTPGAKLVRLDGAKAVFENATVEADVLVVVPPHRPPAVVGDWIEVDPATLRTMHERVWAVGDVTSIKTADGMAFPKAGIMAEGQAKVVARAIVISALHMPADAPLFDGRGHCFVETGGGKAARVGGEFLASPSPKVELTEPSAEGLALKHAFERERLEAWFGA